MKDVVILGSGRSGTSMVAGSLRRAGYDMGFGFKEGTSSNPLGYFESVEINDINEDLLRPVVAGLAARRDGGPLIHPVLAKDQHWLACLPSDVEVAPVPGVDARMAAAAARRPFCFKDPRFCYTLPLWRPHVGPDTVFVCVFREPGRTVNSMMKDWREQEYLRGLGLSPWFAFRVWIQMYERIWRLHRRQGRWLFLHYDQVLQGSGLRRLARVLGADVDFAFPTPTLKRSGDQGPVPRQARILYWKLKFLSWLPT